MDNAVKYTQDGGTIDVSARPDGPFARLTCRDTGLGISPADQHDLFADIYHSSNPEALCAPGTGLGLGIVRRLVQRNGGSIELESDLGVGSVFTVLLPVGGA